VKCGLWTIGQAIHRLIKTNRDRLQTSFSVYGPCKKPTSPPNKGRFIGSNVYASWNRHNTLDTFCIISLVWNKDVRQFMVYFFACPTIEPTYDELCSFSRALIPNPRSTPYNGQFSCTTRANFALRTPNKKRLYDCCSSTLVDNLIY
jgi:hypothetical protein